MVARGRGKKTAAAGPAVAPEAEAVVPNGGVSKEQHSASEVVGPAIVPEKKGRQRGVKKETKEEVVGETIPANVEIPEKLTKPTKAAKGSKKGPRGKAATAAAQEEHSTLENTENHISSIETEPAAVEKKAPIRKRKVENVEKSEDPDSAVKKVSKVTRTKGAKKETVDREGIPEDPAAAGASIAVVSTAQTNGIKKPTSRKRGAPKIDESEQEKETITSEHKHAKVEEIEDEEVTSIPAPAKKGSKSKALKKDQKETKKSTLKANETKKAQQIADEAEEEATEHDVLPEDEFVPEIEEEEEEPKPKKVVKSKGSRKQVVSAPVDEEKGTTKQESQSENEPEPEQQESEIDSVIEQQPKSKGRKAPATKKEKAPAKKATLKKNTKGVKRSPKDDSEDDPQTVDDKDQFAKSENPKAADVEKFQGKMNGTIKLAAKSVAEPKKGRLGKRAAATTPLEQEKKPVRGRKRAAPLVKEVADDEADGSKVAKIQSPLNPTKTEYNSNDFNIDKKFNMKISSWNIAGLRAWLKKDGLTYLQHEQPDILCLQEIKCTPDKLPEEARIPGYHPYWLCMPGGHGGVAVYSKIMPINVEYGIGNAEHDESGRIITAEYEKFYLICVYVPNSGRQLVNLEKRMQWEVLFREYLQKLEKVKPVIIAGDMNVSHKEIDLANPKTNTKSAGFTPQEREEMTKLFALGYVDTFRHFHPNQKGAYTFWTYMKNARAKNVGWRLDYFILSERLVSKAVESIIRPQVLGSDHCPITLFLKI